MLPRFANPHLLPSSSITVSRKELHAEEPGFQADDMDPRLLLHLNELLGLQWESVDQSQSRKRRKMQIGISQDSLNEKTPLPFRLFSGPARPVILRPKPLPIPKVREPEAEDNDQQATLRKQQAEAVAVDATQIHKESKRHTFSRGSNLKQITATLSPIPPAIMIIEQDKPPRSRRPPVLPPSPSPAKRIYQLSLSTLGKVDVSSTRRRQRKKARSKERSAPMYWRPNPAVGGKSLGYAMGFPCSLRALQGRGNKATSYRRDTMRNAKMA